jgi:hypothetical protein
MPCAWHRVVAPQHKKTDLRVRIEVWLKHDDPDVIRRIETHVREEVPSWRHSFKKKTEESRRK